MCKMSSTSRAEGKKYHTILRAPSEWSIPFYMHPQDGAYHFTCTLMMEPIGYNLQLSENICMAYKMTDISLVDTGNVLSQILTASNCEGTSAGKHISDVIYWYCLIWAVSNRSMQLPCSVLINPICYMTHSCKSSYIMSPDTCDKQTSM